MKKFISGKASVAAIVTSLIVLSFFVGKTLTSVFASEETYHDCNVNCPSYNVEWTTSETVYANKIVDSNSYYSCPSGQHTGTGSHSDDCYYDGNNNYAGHATYHATTYKCPNDYVWNDEWSDPKDCHKTTTTSHSATVVYDKSSDDHKCHRPSDSYLKSHYGMSDDAVNSFKSSHNEHYPYTLTPPSGYYLDGDHCYPNPTPVDCVYHYTECSATCGEATKSLVIDTPASGGGAACPTEQTISCGDLPSCEVDQCGNLSGFQSSVPANMSTNNDYICSCNKGYHEVVVEATPVPELTVIREVADFTCEADDPEPTPTPLTCSGSQHLNADGSRCVDWELGGGPSGGGEAPQVLGASTSAQGRVLGASTMAGTGSFLDSLYGAIMTLGGIFTFKGAKSIKKNNKKA